MSQDKDQGAAVRSEAVAESELSYKGADGKYLDTQGWGVEHEDIVSTAMVPIHRNGEVIALVVAEYTDDFREVIAENCRILCDSRRAAGAPSEPSEPRYLSKLLREYAGNSGYSHNDYADTMRRAADALDSQPTDGEAKLLCAMEFEAVDLGYAGLPEALAALRRMKADPDRDREALIACLGDDAATLSHINPDDEMAQTMREAAAMLEADGKALDSQPTDFAIPDGWALVPFKYTPEMRAAWDSSPNSEDDDVDFACAWSAILSVVPKVASQPAASASQEKYRRLAALPFRASEGQAQTSAAQISDDEIDALVKAAGGRWQDSSYWVFEDADLYPFVRSLLARPRAAKLADSTAPGAPVEETFPCWSCKKPYTLNQRSYADGRCPHCDVDIELDDELAASTAQQSLTAGGAVPSVRERFEAWVISEAQRQHPIEPLTEKEKAFVLRRNVWDKDSYEAHDGAWQAWKACAAAPLPQVQPSEAGKFQRGQDIEWLKDGEWLPAKFVAYDLVGREPIIQRAKSMPIFATPSSVRAADQQPVTPSGALGDSNGGVA